MKVVLRKVTSTPLDFLLEADGVSFKGYLEYYKGKLIFLHADMEGSLELQCDVCGDDFCMSLSEKVEFLISDGLYHDDGSLDLDVVESFDGQVDMEELLHSEIELIKSDYHSCEACKKENSVTERVF
ncbi:hypothetical protein MNB_SM-5-574 [hydrothermal vent metagenome]|uniref:DUF177 domain-containing protein n=1 Tax=hydrothermal vent metagenome TaxID=652676 RepID=A0A1W1CEB0_9ZZZZ